MYTSFSFLTYFISLEILSIRSNYELIRYNFLSIKIPSPFHRVSALYRLSVDSNRFSHIYTTIETCGYTFTRTRPCDRFTITVEVSRSHMILARANFDLTFPSILQSLPTRSRRQKIRLYSLLHGLLCTAVSLDRSISNSSTSNYTRRSFAVYFRMGYRSRCLRYTRFWVNRQDGRAKRDAADVHYGDIA